MKAKRLRSLVLGGLVTVMAVWAGLTYWPPAGSQAATNEETGPWEAWAEAEAAGEEAAETVAPTPTERWETLAAAAPSAWPPDPFFRPGIGAEPVVTATEVREDVPRVAAPGPFVLSAVLKGDPPLALINGRIVQVGDALAAGVTVTAIDENGVTILEGERTWVLKLPE